MSAQALFDRFYYSKPGFVRGTEIFHTICRSQLAHGGCILEIGAGPVNPTTEFLAGIGSVTGLDVSPELHGDPHLAEAHVYDGIKMPFPAESFDLCVSNYVLEHVADPASHFQEVFRVLKPQASYCFRNPNRWHYVTMAASLMPHSIRANTRSKLRHWARRSGLLPEDLRMIEAEPSYGAAHPLLFYPMMAYERLVNSTELLGSFRVNILGTFRKPTPPAVPC
jgi:SAM-dependent methyltransferase